MTVDAGTPVNDNPGTNAGTIVGGRYRLHSTIGTGGMGTVWRAYDELLRREVAVKEVLLPPGLPGPERELLCERTLREARAAAALNHPAVIRMYDVVTDGDRPWIVMELLEPRSIADILRLDGPMPARQVAEIGLSVLAALEAAHRAGVLHRDVKPGNVLVGSDGRVTLTDFGVARSANESPLTSTGLLLGSPQYIAPERARGRAFGPASDLFSLGATLYTAVEGRPPFDRGEPLPTMTAVVCEPPDPMTTAGPLAPVLLGLLEKDPEKRWDAARTRAALRDLLAGRRVAGGADQAAGPTERLAPRHRVGRTAAGTTVARGATTEQMPTRSDTAVGRRTTVTRPAQPAAGRPTAVIPQGGTSMQPGAYGPSYGPPQDGYPGSPAYAPPPPRRSRTWMWAAVTVTAALLLGVAGYALVTQYLGGDRGSGSDSGVALSAYQDPRGFSVKVPQGWARSSSGNWVEFRGSDGRKVRLVVEPQPVSQKNHFEGAQFNQADFRQKEGITDFQVVALKETDQKLAGRETWEWEFTYTQGGQSLRRVWRGTVVDGKSYMVYLTAPAQDYDRALIDEITRSFAFS